ncbi:hypothetical protein Tco_0022824, partial [Tanacetum coccineum]
IDWLSRHKAKIVCHEKVVQTPLASGEVLQVQGERTKESPKSLRSTKSDEHKLDDIPIVTVGNVRAVKTTPRATRQGFHSTKSLSVGSTCISRQEEGRFIPDVYILSGIEQADH